MNVPASSKLTQQLEKLGIQIILEEKATVLNDREEEEEEGGEETKRIKLQNSGKVLETDVVIETVGFKPTLNGIVEETFGSTESLDFKGWIQTDDYFRIKGSGGGKVFAYGDCTSSTPNAANIYFRMSNILGHNMKCTLLSRSSSSSSDDDNDNDNGVNENDESKMMTRMIKYEIPFAGYCNTSGPDSGIFYSTKFWTQWLLPWIKNTNMFFSAPRDMIGIQKQFTIISIISLASTLPRE